MVTRESRSKDYPDSKILFYQNHEGFHLKSIDAMIATEEVDSFYDADVLALDPTLEEEIKRWQILMDVKNVRNFDLVQGFKMGLYGSQVKCIDTLLKKYELQTYPYDEETFLRHNTLGDFMLIGDSSTTFNNLSTRPHEEFISTQLGSNYHEQEYLKDRVVVNGYVTDMRSRYPRIKQDYYGWALQQLAAMQSIVYTIVVPGDHSKKPGDIIEMYIPGASGYEEQKTKYNRLLGNDKPKFLVTAAAHQYQYGSDQYITKLEVVKDSYASNPIGILEDLNLDERQENWGTYI